MYFYLLELFQFLLGLCIVIVSFVLIIRHRKPFLNTMFADNGNVRESFETLTSMGYFLVFIPILLFGINKESGLRRGIWETA